MTLAAGTLTASAERVTPEKATRYRRLNQAWQTEAFKWYRLLGECWYPAQFYAHALPNVRFYAGVRSPQGDIEELPPDDWASEQLDRIQDPGGGRSQLLEAFGRINFLAGDGYLVGTLEDDDEGWEFLSASELRAIPGTRQFARVEYPGATPEELDSLDDDAYEPTADGVVAYRIWNRDPEYSVLADSPVRAVLPLYQQLWLAEMAVQARMQSRIANAGVILVSEDLSFGPADGQNDDDVKSDPAMERLTQVFVRSIREPGQASAVVPPIIRAPTEMIANDSVMRHVRFMDPTETYPEKDIREEIRNRIALGLDMPAEIMLGLADSNNWNAFQINEDSWNAHLKPVVVRFCDDLGRAFLRPLAKQEGKEYPGQLVVWFDESAVVNHPNRTEDVRQAYDAGVVSAEKYREVIGLTEEDKPTEEEHQEFLLIKLRGSAQADVVTGQDQGLPAGETPTVSTPNGTGPPPGPPPKPTQETLQNEDSTVTASAWVEQAVGAGELALQRCRSLAGSRIRSRRKDCPDVPNGLLAAALGEESVTFAPAELVAGGASEYVDWLLEAGVGETLARRIGVLVEKRAAATLYEPEPLDAVTTSFVRKSLGGLAVAA